MVKILFPLAFLPPGSPLSALCPGPGRGGGKTEAKRKSRAWGGGLGSVIRLDWDDGTQRV